MRIKKSALFEDYKKCHKTQWTPRNWNQLRNQRVIEGQCCIKDLLPVDIINGLAAGLEDGRLVIYDMSEMQIIYTSGELELGPLLKMDFLEPTDDPCACFYILTAHGNGNYILSCLYSFMYENRATDEHGNVFFENFQHGSMKLEMLMESSASAIMTCQAITRPPKHAEDDAICLFAVSWNALSNGKIKLLLFDINQWYKEEIPKDLVGNQAKSSLATFITNANRRGLDSYLNAATISHFNSIQRCEEHFYPISLSFDWVVIDANNGHAFNWVGIQNKALNMLRASTASLFLEPDIVFERIFEARLLPQFTELDASAGISQSSKCEALLSVALEHNCTGLLRDCIRSWSDGSFSGPNIILSSYHGAELTIQTFKNWIFKRASLIKERCSELCEELLSSSGHPLDQREKKELAFITRQLKILADLYDELMRLNSNQQLEKDESLRLASDYQELLTWLINIGLLPETSRQFCNDDMPTPSSLASKSVSIYPYRQLRDYYIQRRSEIAKVDESYISKKSGSCRLLYIDSFIEHECKCNSRNSGTTHNNNLRELWQQSGGNGLYPPATIGSMLRVMLLKNVDYDSKCAIFFYFFFDLHIALTDGERHDGKALKEIVRNFQKFASVFKLSQSLTRFLQAFWYLDHGNIVAAVDEFLSPFNRFRKVEQWLIELLVESLLLQNGAHLALRILDAHSNLISPSLKLSTLLANNLIGEAFHFVRFKNDAELIKNFFTNCLNMGKLGVIRDFALNEREGKLVENVLRKIQLPGAANLHFVYLLQKSKYIEAVSYLDELNKEKENEKSVQYASILSTETETQANDAIDTPNIVLSAFHTTTAPVTKSLTDIYFRIRDRIKQKETQNRAPVPLSCQLIKENANNLLGGIYHSSALSAHFATCYYDEELLHGKQAKGENASSNIISPLTANNAPFLRKPQTETCRNAIDTTDQQPLSYPQLYQSIEKRRIYELDKEDTIDNGDGVRNLQQQQKIQPPSKKRRMQAEDFKSGFKHFQEKNIVLNEIGLDLTPQLSRSTLAQSLAMQESVGNSNQEIKNDLVKNLKGNELQSILKSNTPEPSEIKSRRSMTPVIKEKTLRFALSTELEPEKQSENVLELQTKYRVVTRSISEESHSEDVEMTQYDTAVTIQPSAIESTTFQVLKENSIKDSGISIPAKPLEAPAPSDSLYQTARNKSLSPKMFGPKPRKPISRLSAEPESVLNKITATEHHNESTSKTTPNNCVTGRSSGLGASISKITSVTTLSSIEFKPQICSSKVGEAQAKLLLEQQQAMSERSTVVMTSDIELHDVENSGPKALAIQPRAPLASARKLEDFDEMIDKATIPAIDTTLGMSSYDVTVDFGATTVDTCYREESSSDLQLLQTAEENIKKERKDEQIDEHQQNNEESTQSSDVIELLSTTEENNSGSNESALEYTDGSEESSYSEVTNNTNSNLVSSDLETGTSDPIIKLDEDDDSVERDELVLLQTNELVAQVMETEVVTTLVEQSIFPEVHIEDCSELTASAQIVEPLNTGTQKNLEKSIKSTVNLEENPEPVVKTPDDIIVEMDEPEKLQMSIKDIQSTEASKADMHDLKVGDHQPDCEVVTKRVETEQLQPNEGVENYETFSEAKEDERSSDSKVQTKGAENASIDAKTELEDIDTSNHFVTPNTSLQVLQESAEQETSKNNSKPNETLQTDSLEATDSKIKYAHLERNRAQSVPPYALLINESEIPEADSYTPKRRSKRGISVPPQTIETAISTTPTVRKTATHRNARLKRKSQNEDSPPQSPSSSRSGRESQQKSLLLGSADTPVLDSPALRTRSRMRSISGNSDATEIWIHSPAVSGKKSRRNSITSNASDQLQLLLTPKGTRGQSTSARSDAEHILLSKRLFKEVEEDAEAENREGTTSQKGAEMGIDIYSSTRRMTRTQRAVLEKSEQISAAMENSKDNQLSEQTQIRQIVTRSKTARSVKSNDDGEDDRASITSSTASETRRAGRLRRLRAQQQHSPNANLTSIPEDDVMGDVESNSKRNKTAKK